MGAVKSGEEGPGSGSLALVRWQLGSGLGLGDGSGALERAEEASELTPGWIWCE